MYTYAIIRVSKGQGKQKPNDRKEARPMGDKKKRRKLREQQATRKARIYEIAIDILTAIISGLVTAVLMKLLKL